MQGNGRRPPPRDGGKGKGPPPEGGKGGKNGKGGPPGGGSKSDDPNATASGVYISGAWLYNALDGDNLDAVEQESRSLDVCLSHPSPFGAYHYHAWSPCLKKSWIGSTSKAPALCKDVDDCINGTSLEDFIL